MENWRLIAGAAAGVVLLVLLLWALAGAAGKVSVWKRLPKDSKDNRRYATGYIFVALGSAALIFGLIVVQNNDTLMFGGLIVGVLFIIIGVTLMILTESRAKRA